MFASRVLPALNTVHEDTETCAVCVRDWAFCRLNIWKRSPQFPLSFLALKAEPWPPTNSDPSLRSIPPLHHPPSSASSLLPISACMKGLDCSQPEQRRVTPELPFKRWVGHSKVGRNGGRGGLKSREKVAILVSLIPKIKKKIKNRGHAFLHFIFLQVHFVYLFPETCELWMYIAFTFLRLETAPL